MVLVLLAGWLAYTESMPPCATGLERSPKAITPTTMATTTSAMTTGTAGGRLRLGLSNSSVMGTCPASYCGLGGLGGTSFSAMASSINSWATDASSRSEEHTSELQSLRHLV